MSLLQNVHLFCTFVGLFCKRAIIRKAPIHTLLLAILIVELVVKTLDYGLAATSRLLKIIGLFCKRDLYKRRYSAKETYNLWSVLIDCQDSWLCVRFLIHTSSYVSFVGLFCKRDMIRKAPIHKVLLSDHDR